MIIRSKAPLRLGLAGGGTDVSPYSDIYGGNILNATLNMYAYASIKPTDNGKIILNSIDKNESVEIDNDEIIYNNKLDLLKAVYQRIKKDYEISGLSYELTTYVDAPAGSGLGASSTLIVAVLGAFKEWLCLPVDDYDLARLAWEIERKDLGLTGGKQDQYAATFGGFNFMEFFDNNRVIVNPLRIKQEYINELEHNLLLYYTGTSRLSSKIIEAQSNNVINNRTKPIEAMHKLKEQSLLMKEALLKGKIDEMGEILDFGWKYKKQMTEEISNPVIDEIYETTLHAGSSGGKISGAGGGGFMIFYCPNNTKYKVIESLQKFGGEFRKYNFLNNGIYTWSTNGSNCFSRGKGNKAATCC